MTTRILLGVALALATLALYLAWPQALVAPPEVSGEREPLAPTLSTPTLESHAGRDPAGQDSAAGTQADASGRMALDADTPPAPRVGSLLVLTHSVAESSRPFYVRAFGRPQDTHEPWGDLSRAYACFHQGEVRIAGVPLGHDLMVRFTGGNERRQEDLFVRGPTAETPEVIVHAPELPLHPAVIVTLIDEAGQPVASSAVQATLLQLPSTVPPDLSSEIRPPGVQTAVTDAWGRLRRVVPMRHEDDSTRWLWVEHVTVEGTTRRIIRRGLARLEAQELTEPETVLGAVRLEVVKGREREVVIVTGRIVRSDRGKVRGAHVLALVPSDRPGGGGWALGGLNSRVERDGSFEIRGTGEVPPRVRLDVSMVGHAPERLEITPPRDDIEITLYPGGTLQATYVLPPGVPSDRIQGYLQRDGGMAASPNQGPGEFGRHSLTPGRYDVFIKVRSSQWELVRVSDIDVPAGGEATDPRLKSIDLRGRVRVLRLRLLDAQSKPLAGGTACSIRDAAGLGLQVRVDVTGRVLTPVPAHIENFRVTTSDAEAEVAWAEESQDIVLRPRGPR